MDNDLNAERLKDLIIDTIRVRKPLNVEQLIALVKSQLPASDEEVLAAALELQNQEQIDFQDQSLSNSRRGAKHLKPKQIWYWITVATSAVTMATVFMVPTDAYPWSYIRNVLGLVFVLWLPGFAFTKAVFPERLPFGTLSADMASIIRIALSIGVSIALAPIVGLVLYYTQWGVSLVPITLALLSLTIGLATIAFIRNLTHITT